jgi:glycine oxidase
MFERQVRKMPFMARIVVVGGGVIGCAAAERLARDGHSVVLVERDRIGAHASGAAAGLLAPYSEGEENDGARSLAMFPELAERLEKETGIDIEYRAGESFTPAMDTNEEAALKGLAGGRWLDAIELQRAEPAVHPDARGAVIFPESQVTPPRFTAALAAAAARQGAEIHEGAPAVGFEATAGSVTAVLVPGRRLPADFIVLAAGPWTAEVAGRLGFEVPIWPSRGQLVRFRLAAGQKALNRMLTWRGRYLVPKPDGTVVAGSTEEAVGFDARVTAAGVESLLRFARSVVPALGEATVEWLWAALRPATADGREIVAPAPGYGNLLVASGHNRNGILLAPITAERLAAMVRGSISVR